MNTNNTYSFLLGAAFDDNVANYYSYRFSKELPDYEFAHRRTVAGTAYGVIIKQDDRDLQRGALLHFFNSFFEGNEDHRESIIAQAMAGIRVGLH